MKNQFDCYKNKINNLIKNNKSLEGSIIAVRLFKYLFLIILLSNSLFISSASAQELLLNGSFESPVVTSNGNNLGVVIPNWTSNYQTNIVKPFVGYLPAGPDAPPTGGGNQYYDANSNGAVATITQSFTVPQNGIIDFSAWFSIRDSKQAGTATISIVNSSSTTIASASVSFLST